ncbi:MAG: hypothetical protein V1489_02790 [Candidatus Liptonbacteria bacterium]
MSRRLNVQIIFTVPLLVAAFGLMVRFPMRAEAATLEISPTSGVVSVGGVFTAQIVVKSPNEAVNAISGILNFPTNILEVESISKSGSVGSWWIQEPAYSNSTGMVHFETVVLNPGFTGNQGKVLSVSFRAKTSAAGSNATFFITDAHVLANDGSGTEILSGTRIAKLSVGAVKTSKAEPERTEETIEPLSIPPGRKLAINLQVAPWASSLTGVVASATSQLSSRDAETISASLSALLGAKKSAGSTSSRNYIFPLLIALIGLLILVVVIVVYDSESLRRASKQLFPTQVDALILKTGILSFAVCIILLVASSLSSEYYYRIQLNAEAINIEQTIVSDLNNLTTVRDALIAKDIFYRSILERDTTAIQYFAEKIRLQTGYEILVTDADGIVLFRTAPSEAGDSVFESTSFGRVLARGEQFSGIVRGTRFPLLMLSGAPIKHEDIMVGTVSFAKPLDAEYAKQLSFGYPVSGTELAFFGNNEYIASSFIDQDSDRLLNTYIKKFPDTINFSPNIPEQEYQLNGSNYFIRSLVLNNWNGDIIGFTIFFPSSRSISRTSLSLIIGALFLLSLIIVRLCLPPYARHKGRCVIAS